MDDQEVITEKCAKLISRLNGLITFAWDAQHNALLANFSVDKADQVWLITNECFAHNWDFRTIKKAPGLVKHRARQFSALNKKQKLLANEIDDEQVVMLAWWPWGHGATISLRLFVGDMSDYQPKPSLITKFKGMFGKTKH